MGLFTKEKDKFGVMLLFEKSSKLQKFIKEKEKNVSTMTMEDVVFISKEVKEILSMYEKIKLSISNAMGLNEAEKSLLITTLDNQKSDTDRLKKAIDKYQNAINEFEKVSKTKK